MNSSEPLQPLTPHEERLTAYLDGQLAPEDAAIFERENPDALALKQEQQTLAKALRQHSRTPALGNGDFFNHQILRQIQPPAPAVEPKPAFSLWRLVFAGAACVLATVAIFQSMPTQQSQPDHRTAAHAPSAPMASASAPKYLAQVTKVEAGDYLLTAKLVNADGLAVVWVEGMDKLSPDYVLQ